MLLLSLFVYMFWQITWEFGLSILCAIMIIAGNILNDMYDDGK